MNPFHKKILERHVGKTFKLHEEYVPELYEITRNPQLIESAFNEAYSEFGFETYLDFLNENVALPVVQPSAPQAKRYSFATMKADMAGAHTKWKDRNQSRN
jgi:hypothetical protein